MSRIVIEVSGDQHQKIKTLAALSGKSIKDFVLEKVLQNNANEEEQAWSELKEVLVERIHSAQKGELSDKTMLEIASGKVDELKSQ